MTQPATRGPEFTPEEIERALLALALKGGNTQRARDLLELDSTIDRVPSKTALHEWKHAHAERFNELRDQTRPKIEADAVRDYAVIVARTNELHLQGLEQTAATLHDLDAKDASAAVKNLAIAGGVAADKLLVFTDRPNQITERRDPEQILRAIESIAGTAEDITPEALTSESEPSNPRELSPPASS